MRQVQVDALVIGAGPAGSAAACVLAHAGRRVLLVDRARFPRDKVCGDALAPDALAALARLGLREAVGAAGRTLRELRLQAPGGEHTSLATEIVCLPRRRLDALMRDAAIARGAEAAAPLRLVRAIEEGGAVSGATFVDEASAEPLQVRAPFTLLATGAAAGPLQAFEVCERKARSAIAARVYVQAPPALAAAHERCVIAFDRRVFPGYGWAFAGPGGTFNIGVGYFEDMRARPATTNLRALLAGFVGAVDTARELVSASEPLGDVRGAPLRTGLAGARLARPGLFVVGEAAGLTYSLTGEGIGKAIESGMLAAEATVDALARRRADRDAVAHAYAARLRTALGRRFAGYARAQRWMANPALADLLVRRANAGRYARARMEAVLAERALPQALFSPLGALRSWFG